MKIQLFFCSLLYLFSLSLFAQNTDMRNMTPEEIAERQTKMMKDSLNLNEEQVVKAQLINLEYAQKLQKIWGSDMERVEKFQELQVMQSNKEYELKKVFTKEQFKLYQKQQEALRAKRREGRQ